MAAPSYRTAVDERRIAQIRQITHELPASCSDFLRGIAMTTSTFTRLAYALDLRTFFHYLAEERVAFNQEASDDCESWDNLVDRDVEQQLKLALQKLPPKCRQAFELSYFQEMTYREVAEKMNISPRTVEEHVQKATNLLRNDLRYLLYSTLLAILH